MIKAIIFDFFGVLVTEGFKQFRELYFLNDEQKDRQAIDLVNQADSGLMPQLEFRKRLAELAGVATQEVEKILGRNMPNLPLFKYIERRLKQSYKLGILSNSSGNYPKDLLNEKQLRLFDDVILSYELGIIKPDPGIYQLASQRLGVKPEECVFVDDSEGHCYGAEKAGMKAILYRQFRQFRNELEKILAAGPDH